jgi:hypothetical protein
MLILFYARMFPCFVLSWNDVGGAEDACAARRRRVRRMGVNILIDNAADDVRAERAGTRRPCQVIRIVLASRMQWCRR